MTTSFGPFLLKAVHVSDDSLVLELEDKDGTVYTPKRRLRFSGTEAAQHQARRLIGSMVTTETYDPSRWPATDWWSSIHEYTASPSVPLRRLHALRIGNFKAFADTQRIPLKPITLIFGPNSAGKSSFIHSLALAHEAQFARDKRSLARLDVHHTEVGGSSIDLGGFRQYVHRGQASKRVEWGAELKVSTLDPVDHQQLAQLLAPVENVGLSITLGIELDDQDRPKPGAEPRVEAVEISADGAELLRMSRRPASARDDGGGSTLRVDRLDSRHAVFRQLIQALIQVHTTSETLRPEDEDAAHEAIGALLPDLLVTMARFFPSGVELPNADRPAVAVANAPMPQRPRVRGAATELRRKRAFVPPSDTLIPLSRGNRAEGIAQAIRLVLPRRLDDLVSGLANLLADELQQFQYLGPLRSFPPRHLAFAEQEDANWYAGGGYAWDVVRRDGAVREAVNAWLGNADKLKTPYKLVVRSLWTLDQLQPSVETGLEALQDSGLDIEPDYDGKNPDPVGAYPVIKDLEAAESYVSWEVYESATDRVRELVLLDQRRNTVVTHRDVGIGISQVLPVLVMAYGSQGKLLAMEQPEIHLHPALQAELGDVFIESALGERKNTFILETHSEHLILRLMRRIREGKLQPEDVGVFFVEPLPQGSRFTELRLDEEGDFIDEWPGGFFEESFHEKFAGR